MVLGFFRHVYDYFVQETNVGHQNQPPRAQSAIFSLENVVPLLDKHGQIRAYVSGDSTSLEPVLPKNSVEIASQGSAAVPITAQTSTAAPPAQGPFVKADVRPTSLPAPVSVLKSAKNVLEKWDPWPDGTIQLDLNWREVGESKKLLTHWVERATGGDRKGDELAEVWEKGKRSTRTCLGVLVCDNGQCNRLTRPKVDPARLDAQKREVCECQADLVYQACGVRSVLWSWRGGIRYHHEGIHHHARPPPKHATMEEAQHFATLVKQNPKSGPLELMVGVPTFQGPGESVADISDIYLNADRVSKERLKIKHGDGLGSGDAFIAAFAEFDVNHPAFLVSEVFGAITVVSFQTPLMVSQLIHDAIIDSPVNGLVNDAAHGWWKEHNSLLMITSAYSPELRRWVPGLFSYTNGATANHYMHHFTALMETMALEAERRGIVVEDRLFSGVMDFSDAERNGFINAFISFWTRRSDSNRNEEDLRKNAQHILRGCKEHFRAGVTRLSRINGVIPPERREIFIQRALALVSVSTHVEFIDYARLIMRDFPATATWLAWWLRPAHATMLFESQKTMEAHIWESIPDTNNAEEAMHWKLYSAAGKHHLFFHGLNALYAVAVYYARLFNANNNGIAIRYGDAERWKQTKTKIGRTKPTRAPNAAAKKQTKNDGRPPDTIKDLLLAGPTKRQKKEVSQLRDELDMNHIIRIPSYPWENNSCWLDTSLELLHATISHDFDDFTQACQSLPSDSVLRTVYNMLQMRHNLPHDAPNISATLSKQRNNLRTKIVRAKEANSMLSYEPLFSWLRGLINRESVEMCYRFQSYFETLIVEIHTCTGSSDIGGKHLEICKTPQRHPRIHLRDHAIYNGDVSLWFAKFLSGQGTEISNQPCWRSKEAEVLCPGVRTDIRGLVIGIPTMLMLNIPDSERSNRSDWTFPETLTPLTKTLVKRSGLIYDLVGFGLYSKKAGHFTARYALKSHSDIFIYDGMKNDGYALQKDQGRFSTHLAGSNQGFPNGYTVSYAVYHLRGGSKAKNAFFDARRTVYSKRFNLDVAAESPSALPTCSYKGKLVELDPRARTWMIGEALRKQTIEYVSSNPVSMVQNQSKTIIPLKAPARLSTPELAILASDDKSVESEEPFTADQPPSPTKSNSSLPDSLFPINCRCGVKGNGNLLYREEEGVAVQCDECRDWSHVACQRNGRASLLGDKDKFTCDFCDTLTILSPQYQKQRRESARKILGSRLRLKKPLHQRLLAGRGALARSREFWYPVRVIQYKSEEKVWLVRWWRECVFEARESPALGGSITAVSESDVVDSLWGDRIGRRKIRLGKWVHAHEIPTAEDILSDPSSVPHTPEMHEALSPSIKILQAILADPDSENVKAIHIPAKLWLESQRKNIRTTIVPFTGNLSVIERAQLGNWFEVHVAKDKGQRRLWLSLLPFAHTCTLWLVTLLRKNKGQLQKFDINDDNQVLKAAWQLQTTHSPDMVWKDRIDIDRECLEQLEEEMFERSSFAGIAGNYQWGLDSGDHQDGWNPYAGTENWNHDDRDSGEDEHMLGPNYITVEKPVPEAKPQPKPRLRSKTKK